MFHPLSSSEFRSGLRQEVCGSTAASNHVSTVGLVVRRLQVATGPLEEHWVSTAFSPDHGPPVQPEKGLLLYIVQKSHAAPPDAWARAALPSKILSPGMRLSHDSVKKQLVRVST